MFGKAKTDLKALYKMAKSSNHSLHQELPYRYFDEETGVFENSSSIGFGLELFPLSGVDNSTIEALNSLICSLPEGNKWDYQFTLIGDTRKGRRPSFIKAAHPEKANEFYNMFNEVLQSRGLRVETGIFGAMMDVELINDGPVTILVESKSN